MGVKDPSEQTHFAAEQSEIKRGRRRASVSSPPEYKEAAHKLSTRACKWNSGRLLAVFTSTYGGCLKRYISERNMICKV